MKVIVLPQAADEFDDAVAHYDDKQPGLGQRFRDEVDGHVQWIVGHPEIPRLRSGGYRRVNLKIFPHYIAYLQLGETVWVLAIAHGHREPEYWINRKKGISQPSAPPHGDQQKSSASSGGLGGPPPVS